MCLQTALGAAQTQDAATQQQLQQLHAAYAASQEALHALKAVGAKLYEQCASWTVQHANVLGLVRCVHVCACICVWEFINESYVHPGWGSTPTHWACLGACMSACAFARGTHHQAVHASWMEQHAHVLG